MSPLPSKIRKRAGNRERRDFRDISGSKGWRGNGGNEGNFAREFSLLSAPSRRSRKHEETDRLLFWLHRQREMRRGGASLTPGVFPATHRFAKASHTCLLTRSEIPPFRRTPQPFLAERNSGANLRRREIGGNIGATKNRRNEKPAQRKTGATKNRRNEKPRQT